MTTTPPWAVVAPALMAGQIGSSTAEIRRCASQRAEDAYNARVPDAKEPLRRVVTSCSAALRLEAARDWLAGSGRPLLIVAPSRLTGDDLVRDVARSGVPTLGFHRTTLGLLASGLAEPMLARSGLAPLTDVGALALAARAISEAEAAGELGVLGPVAGKPGFVRAVASTLQELRSTEVTSARLRDLAGAGVDLSALSRRFDRAARDWGLADHAQRLRTAIRAIEDGVAASVSWLEMPQLWLDLSLRSPLSRRFFAAVAKPAPAVLVTVPHGDKETLLAVEKTLGVSARAVEPPAITTRLSRTQLSIFEQEAPDLPGRPVADDESFVFYSAAGEGQECVELVRRIRDLATRGVAFDEIGVAVRGGDGYLPLLEDAFKRAGIPAFFTHGLARPDPAGRAFLSLLACAADGLSASRFAEYLSLGQVPRLEEDATPPVRPVPWVEPSGEQLVLVSLVDQGERDADDRQVEPTFVPDAYQESGVEGAESDESEADEPVGSVGPDVHGGLPAPARWEHLLIDAAVVGGVDRWRRRLDGLERELGRRVEELGPEEINRRAALERELAQLRILRGFALPVIEQLAELPEEGTWRAWIDALERLAARVLRRPGTVLRLLAELRPMSDVDTVTIAEVQQVLREPLSFLRSEPPARRYGRVWVGTVSELPGRAFRVLMVPGLAEGGFPRRFYEDPLLLDRARERLDAGLARMTHKSQRERLLLRLAVGAATEQLVVSYPRVDTQRGRAQVPSFYALDLLRSAEGSLPELDTLVRRAAAASAADIGWPAPARARDAIDDAEYDLALLRPWLGAGGLGDGGDGRGQARFLLSENSHLHRSVHARARRWRRPWTWADGLVARDADEPIDGMTEQDREQARAALAVHRPTRRSYSPTALQHYSACPYRFLLQAIHRLRPREDRTGPEQLDPLTRGSLIHELQFDVFKRLRTANVLPVAESNLADALDLLDAVVDAGISRFAEDLAPAIDRVFESEMESIRNDLRGWLRQVAAEPGWVPQFAELSFGLPPSPDRDERSTKDPALILGRFLLRGAIDLVERSADERRWRVTDHKTGKARSNRRLVVAGGQVLQPVLYALAAEQVLGLDQDEHGRLEQGALFFCTQRGEYQRIDVPMSPEARTSAKEVFEQVDAALAGGFLPAAPDQGACRWCDYRPVCGPYEEIRLQRKSPEPLETLWQLRRLP